MKPVSPIDSCRSALNQRIDSCRWMAGSAGWEAHPTPTAVYSSTCCVNSEKNPLNRSVRREPWSPLGKFGYKLCYALLCIPMHCYATIRIPYMDGLETASCWPRHMLGIAPGRCRSLGAIPVRERNKNGATISLSVAKWNLSWMDMISSQWSIQTGRRGVIEFDTFYRNMNVSPVWSFLLKAAKLLQLNCIL